MSKDLGKYSNQMRDNKHKGAPQIWHCLSYLFIFHHISNFWCSFTSVNIYKLLVSSGNTSYPSPSASILKSVRSFCLDQYLIQYFQAIKIILVT